MRKGDPLSLARSTPLHLPLPAEAAQRAKELLTACRFHTSVYGGGHGWAMTDDPAVRDELLDGWPVITEDGETVRVAAGSTGSFAYAPGGGSYYELSLPPALVTLSRELHDAARVRVADTAEPEASSAKSADDAPFGGAKP